MALPWPYIDRRPLLPEACFQDIDLLNRLAGSMLNI
jgi:hypothetical protein